MVVISLQKSYYLYRIFIFLSLFVWSTALNLVNSSFFPLGCWCLPYRNLQSHVSSCRSCPSDNATKLQIQVHLHILLILLYLHQLNFEFLGIEQIVLECEHLQELALAWCPINSLGMEKARAIFFSFLFFFFGFSKHT